MNYAYSSASQSSSPRILIANEHPVEALALESLLRAERYLNVRVTTDVREIAPMYVRWPFDLLIFDMHSTLINGVTMLQSLARSISTTELAVVALVNLGAEQERMAALAAGAVDTLSRPLRHEDVLPRIKRALGSNVVDVLPA